MSSICGFACRAPQLSSLLRYNTLSYPEWPSVVDSALVTHLALSLATSYAWVFLRSQHFRPAACRHCGLDNVQTGLGACRPWRAQRSLWRRRTRPTVCSGRLNVHDSIHRSRCIPYHTCGKGSMLTHPFHPSVDQLPLSGTLMDIHPCVRAAMCNLHSGLYLQKGL